MGKLQSQRLARVSDSRGHRERKRIRSRRLRLEPLEDRRVLSSVAELADWLGRLETPLVHENQIFYLDFGGAEDVSYDGPVRIDDIDVPPFSAEPFGLAGREELIVPDLVEELNAEFGKHGLLFTADYPVDAVPHSTIYVGGDDSAFVQYGEFLGLAEQVDKGNVDPCDIGFVFSDSVSIASLGSPVSVAPFDVTGLLSPVIAHEAMHLLGFEHDVQMASETSPLADVAMFDYPLSDRFSWGTGPSQHFGGQATGVDPSYIGHLATDIPASGLLI